MKFDPKSLEIIARYSAEPNEQQPQYAASTLWWTILAQGLGDTLRMGGDVSQFLSAERDLFDAGLIGEIESGFTHDQLFAGASSSPLRIVSMSDLILSTVARVTSGDRQAQLERELLALRLELRNAEEELVDLQSARAEVLAPECGSDRSMTVWLSELPDTDLLIRRNLADKRRMAKGAIFAVEERRDLAAREQTLAKQVRRNEGYLSQIRAVDAKKKAHDACSAVAACIERAVIADESVNRKLVEIEKVSNEQRAMTPAEIDAGITKELDYLKEVVKLAARRQHTEQCPFLRPGAKPFTAEQVASCLSRVLEFDPMLMKNDRVNLFGKPSVLLVPGCGNGLYDWKNNLLILPFVPAGGAHMASVAAAFIEYRLDVDEDHRLVNAYTALPDQKGIRSQVTIRENLTRDYVRWMTSEYEGFKVLSKETRIWFEREIAPKRNEPVCPNGLQSFELVSEVFNARVKELSELVGPECSGGSDAELFESSILEWHQGQFERSYKCLVELDKRNSAIRFAAYNLAIAAIRVGRKQEAIAAFNTFTEKNPQGFWAAAARDFVRRLQMA